MLPMLEATLDEIEGKLLKLSVSQLCGLCERLKLNVGEGETHASRAEKMQYLEGKDVVSLEDEGLSVLWIRKDKIDSLRMGDEEEIDSASSVERKTITKRQRKVDLERHPTDVMGTA